MQQVGVLPLHHLVGRAVGIELAQFGPPRQGFRLRIGQFDHCRQIRRVGVHGHDLFVPQRVLAVARQERFERVFHFGHLAGAAVQVVQAALKFRFGGRQFHRRQGASGNHAAVPVQLRLGQAGCFEVHVHAAARGHQIPVGLLDARGHIHGAGLEFGRGRRPAVAADLDERPLGVHGAPAQQGLGHGDGELGRVERAQRDVRVGGGGAIGVDPGVHRQAVPGGLLMPRQRLSRGVSRENAIRPLEHRGRWRIGIGRQRLPVHHRVEASARGPDRLVRGVQVGPFDGHVEVRADGHPDGLPQRQTPLGRAGPQPPRRGDAIGSAGNRSRQQE